MIPNQLPFLLIALTTLAVTPSKGRQSQHQLTGLRQQMQRGKNKLAIRQKELSRYITIVKVKKRLQKGLSYHQEIISIIQLIKMSALPRHLAISFPERNPAL